MDRGNVLSGAPFKSAMLSAVIFLAVLVTTGAVAFVYVQSTMIGTLQSQIDSETALLDEIYRDGGTAGLVEAVHGIEKPGKLLDRAVGLFDAAGNRLAGNIAAPPQDGGARRARLTIGVFHPGDNAFRPLKTGLYYVAVAPYGADWLVLGESLDLVAATERAMVQALSLAGFVVVASILVTGYLVSRESLGKLEGIERNLDRISQGDMTARLDVSPQNDQIDRISRRVNAHLDRLSRLMTGTKSTAAAIAHDLKTPLTRAFLGLEQAVGQIRKREDPLPAIEASQDELQRLDSIFETILRIVRIESRDEATALKPVELGPLIEDLAETYAPVAEDAGQTLEVRIPPGVPCRVMGDAPMLQQLVVNLLQNAISHCPPGTDLTLALERGDGRVTLIVADTGPGIPEAERDRVLDPFYRVASARRDAGSGLGLALVKSVADRHEAEIRLADNAPGLRVEVSFTSLD